MYQLALSLQTTFPLLCTVLKCNTLKLNVYVLNTEPLKFIIQ